MYYVAGLKSKNEYAKFLQGDTTGKDIAIREVAETMREVVGYDGVISFDNSKPDGPVKKLIDVSRLSNMGWNYNIDLKEGLEKTYDWYLKNQDAAC